MEQEINLKNLSEWELDKLLSTIEEIKLKREYKELEETFKASILRSLTNFNIGEYILSEKNLQDAIKAFTALFNKKRNNNEVLGSTK